MRALIVIDYQKDFVSGALGFEGAQAYDARIAARIRQAREAGETVIFTYDTHTENYRQTKEGANLPIPHCLVNSDGWELYGQVAQSKQAQDIVFHKPTFGSLELANYLQQQGFEQVELCGLVSYICVLSNAVLAKAALPEAEIVVDSALTGAADTAMTEKALDILRGLHITVK
mgnify:CR=1 FL=1